MTPTPAGALVCPSGRGLGSRSSRSYSRSIWILTPVETEPWGERYLQVEDPNGVVIQLVEWVAEPTGVPDKLLHLRL